MASSNDDTMLSAKTLALLTTEAKRTAEAFKAIATQATRSGMFQGIESANKGFELLGATVGTLLMPAFALVSAGAMTLADLLFGDVKSGLGQFGQSLAMLGEGFVTVMGKMQSWGNSLGEWLGKKIYGEIPEVGGGLKNTPEGRANAAAAGARDTGADVRGLFAQNLKDIAQDMRQNQAPAGFSGIADAARKIQTQSFQSNIQQKFLDRFDKVITVIDGMGRKLDNVNAVN